MATFREKDESDLRWASIRRRITREIDTQLADYRDRKLNEALTTAFAEYMKALSKGKVLKIESKYDTIVTKALDKALDVDVKVEKKKNG